MLDHTPEASQPREPERSKSASGSLGWLFLTAAVVCEVMGSLSLKGALTSPVLYIIVAVSYTCAFAFLTLTLRSGMALGVAYGIWGAVGVALTAVMSRIVFDEPLTPVMLMGIAVIIAGVLCVELGSQQSRRRNDSEQPGAV